MGLSRKQVSSDVQDWNPGDLLQSSSGDSGSSSSMESPTPPTKRQQAPIPQPAAEKLKCPRCDSANTKFCYYNNYNKSQPRYFCKACKRHWTKGGMLRNVPVGGGRKNKRLKTSANTKAANISVHASEQGIGLPLVSAFQDSLNESNFTGVFGGSSVQATPHNHCLKFTYPSFSSVDYGFPCSVSSASADQIPNLYGLNNGDSSVMAGFDTSLNDRSSWPSNESTGNWDWDDMDKFVISDVTIPWDDAEIN